MQSLNVGNDIRIVILDVTGETVRIGIEAPPEISVYRSEVYEALQKENREAMEAKDIFNVLKKAMEKKNYETP